MSCQVVPWYDSEEWLRVYSALFSPAATSDTRRAALNTLLVWKARSPALPSGIESTLSLLEVGEVGTASERVLRLAYSAAITRFVNHMLDSEQARGLTLYHAARNADIPDWVINIRHTAAHGDSLPSLDSLLRASDIAFTWLRKNYWEPQKEIIADYFIGAPISQHTEKKLTRVVSFCASLSIYRSEPHIKNLSHIPDAESREAIIKEAKELFDGTDFSDPSEVTIYSLLTLVSSLATKLLKHKNASSVVSRTLLEPNALFLSLEVLSLFDEKLFKKDGLNRQYVRCWEVLLTFLHTNGLMAAFVWELVEVTKDEVREGNVRRLAALWLREILRALRRSKLYIDKLAKLNLNSVQETPSKKKKHRQYYQELYPNEKRSLTLNLTKPVPEELTNILFIRPIVTSYNPYLALFIRDLLALLEPKLSNEKVEQLFKLANLISGKNVSLKTGSQDKVFTINEVNAEYGTPVGKTIAESSDSDCMEVEMCQESPSGIWRLSPNEYDWSKCPLGVLPCNIKMASV